MGLNHRHNQDARRALSLARLLARDYQHGVVDTDHLFVGILQADGTGARVLRDLNVDVRRAELESRILHDVEDPLAVAMALTPALDRVLELSSEEARWLGHETIGTEHLLLALARSRAGGVEVLLQTLGLNSEQIKRRVRRVFSDTDGEHLIEAAKHSARLSELSRRVLNAAGQLALDQTPGLGHALVVLTRERRSSVTQMLGDCGLDSDELQMALGTAAPESPMRAGALLDEVLECAADHANRLGMHYTGTEHILLAFAENTHGAQLLTAHGTDVAQLIQALNTSLQSAAR